MSSPPSSASLTSEADGEAPLSKSNSTSPNRAIAFLVHSPDSISNNLPPDCDNKPLARQRRRRTSPDDQRILEEAFARNPRPSKEERRDIISKVALGDKEVQIWFQNRRQSSRRKSKPIESHDVDSRSNLRSSSPILTSDGGDIESEKAEKESVAQEVESEMNTTTVPVVDGVKAVECVIQSHEELGKAESAETVKVITGEMRSTEVESQETVLTASIVSSQGPPPSTCPTDLNGSQDAPLSSQDAIYSSITRPTYLANRRSATFARNPADEPTSTSQPMANNGRTPSLKKSGSYLRLSMTEDGQAKVIDRSAPSPPRSQPTDINTPIDQPAANGLRRSYSAAGLNDLFKQSAVEPPSRSKVPRVSQVGRSRDSRAWEFWCDSEARTSLANKAEQENSGSAADAIGLMRQSSRSALRPNSRKANSPMVSTSSFLAANTGKPARPKLQRASTTVGRLQQQTKANPTKKGAEEALDRSPDADSDKENWDPEDNQADVAPRRRAQTGASNPQRGRTILGENSQIPSYQTSLGGLMDSEKKRRAAAPTTVDAEVAAFMAASSEVDELDCVQSLLSLSKGNWR